MIFIKRGVPGKHMKGNDRTSLFVVSTIPLLHGGYASVVCIGKQEGIGESCASFQGFGFRVYTDRQVQDAAIRSNIDRTA